MFLNNLFKTKKKKTGSDPIKPQSKPVSVKKEKTVGKEPQPKPAADRTVSKSQFNSAYPILISPHVTEKATAASGENSYIFKVYPRANKTEIKKAIQYFYKVKVIGVRIINIAAKKRRLGRTRGWKHGYKKAIVRIRKDQKIDLTIV